jgi:prepilin-type processing-associated H-X9-DG protein
MPRLAVALRSVARSQWIPGDATRIALLLLLASGSVGCATTTMLIDTVVPNPVAHVAIEGGSRGPVVWTATYGRKPRNQNFFFADGHVHVERSGVLEVPPSHAACEPVVYGVTSLTPLRGRVERLLPASGSAAPLPDGFDGCAYVIARDGADPRSLQLLEPDGAVIGTQRLPVDIPFLSPRRLATLVVAPLADVVTTVVLTYVVLTGKLPS